MSNLRRRFGRFIAANAARSVLWRYGIGIGFAVVAFLVTDTLFSLQRSPFFPLFSLAVVASSILGGRSSGLVTTAASVFLNVLFVPPRGSFWVADSEILIRIGVFLVAGTVVSLLIGLIGELQRVLDIERNRLFTTIASIGDCVIATDANGRVTFLNRVAEDTTGWTSNDATGKPLEEVFHIVNEKTRQPVPDPVRKVLETGRVVGLANHTVLIRRDGSEVPIDDSAAPIRDLHGEIAGVVLVFRDVTRERQAEAALIRSEKLATVGRMAASIAHEINNPLTAISNLLFLIENAPDVGEASRRLVQTAQSELNRVSYVTKHTLSFARRSAEREPVELGGLVDEVLALYANKINGSSIQVLKRYRDYAVAECSANEARHVIANVVANALDASRTRGKLYVRIARSEWRSNPRVRLTIADVGTGIAPQHLPKLFEPFFSTKTETGTGLGLWVTKQIIDNHGGSVQVRSRVGRGTVVVVCWPVAMLRNSEVAAPN